MVNRVERGWAGHFICAKFCLFRRNTLLVKNETRVVVSTVGNYYVDADVKEIGIDCYYKTMAFFAEWDGKYYDANVGREVHFEAMRAISTPGDDNLANDMHEHVVEEIAARMEAGVLVDDEVLARKFIEEQRGTKAGD